MQCSDSPTHVRWFDPQDGDHCYIRINPNLNEWVKGTIVRQVIGVPNSFVVDVDGHKYRQNKRDITLIPPKSSDSDSNESGGDDHQDEHTQPMRDVVKPTLCLRPTIKFPRLPVQAMSQKDFQL